jgi:hypothetical protein
MIVTITIVRLALVAAVAWALVAAVAWALPERPREQRLATAPAGGDTAMSRSTHESNYGYKIKLVSTLTTSLIEPPTP